MNIKYIKLFTVALSVAMLTSCGGNSDKKENIQSDDLTEETTINSDVENASNEIENNSTKETDEVVSTSKGNNDVDAYLKSYEEYVDQYIKLMKKAKDGDMSAMTEYAEYMEKATDLSEKMEKAESEMSSAQMAKFLKIQAKLTQAASNMY